MRLKYRKSKTCHGRVSEFIYFATFTLLPSHSHIASTGSSLPYMPSLVVYIPTCTVCKLARARPRSPAHAGGRAAAGGQNDSHLWCRRSTRSVCFADRTSFFPRRQSQLTVQVSQSVCQSVACFQRGVSQSGAFESPYDFTVEIAKRDDGSVQEIEARGQARQVYYERRKRARSLGRAGGPLAVY